MAEYYPPPPPGTHYTYYPPPPPPPQPYIPQAEPPPPPAFASYVNPLATYNPYGEVRTLFVAGLPEDVKPREIYNLFREFPGYESSHLRTPTHTSQPFAFAVFSGQQSAIVAMQALNGMVFDLDKGSTLYIDLAKSNSRSKRSRTDDEWTGSDKKARGSFSSGTHDSGFGSVHMPGMANSAYNMIAYPSTQSHGNFDARAANEIAAGKLNNSSASHAPKSGTPCPTLFVANLGATCTEQELTQVFLRCPGFLKLKMQSTYGPPVAFVDFQDTASSTAALNTLQGTILYSSPAGDGIRLEYPFNAAFFFCSTAMPLCVLSYCCFCFQRVGLTTDLDMQNQGWESRGSRSSDIIQVETAYKQIDGDNITMCQCTCHPSGCPS